MDIPRLIFALLALGFSVILHEIMHGWSALKMGDPSARDDGRLTLNPIPHISVFQTILLPILTYWASMGTFMFGGAKPVRINPLNFRHPGRGMMISAAAGPLTNLALAVAGFGLLFALHKIYPSLIYETSEDLFGRKLYALNYNGYFFAYLIWINLFLTAFNLIPIPPLDGARVLRHFLPSSGKEQMDRIEPYGLMIVIFLVAFGLTRILIYPFHLLMLHAVNAVFGSRFLQAFAEVLWS